MLPNTGRHVALLRGINVGASTRVAMADLRETFTAAGLGEVRTHLQSGNVIFSGDADVSALEAAILTSTGVATRVLIVPASRFVEIAHANPLRAEVTDQSKGLITFLDKIPEGLKVPTGLDGERLAIGDHAVYQWLPNGVLSSRVPPSFRRSLGPLATARNLRTVDKIVELVSS